MYKSVFKSIILIIGFCILVSSCQKAPYLTMTGPHSFTFNNEGGNQKLAFSCNRDWSISSSESWLQVSPSSGAAQDGDITVTVTCSPNTTFDTRISTLTLTVEGLIETITVTQEMGLGLLVSPHTFELTNAAQNIEIEIQKNVQYSVVIDDACKDCISHIGTRALSSEKATFSIASNETYDNREGKVTIKQTDGPLATTVTIRQGQTNGLFVTTPEYDLSNEEHTLCVEVKANVDFQVSPQVDWIQFVETRALSPSTIVLAIDANKTYDNRVGTVLVKQKNGDLSGTITITQKQTDGLFVTQTSVEITNEEQKVELTVNNNVSFDIVIPDNARDWISVQSNTATRALANNKVVLDIAQNVTFDNREASITIKQTDGPLAATVKILQAQTDGLFITTPEYILSNEKQIISVEIETNVDVEVSSDVDWINNLSTRGLASSIITLSVDENESYDARVGKVNVKQINGDLSSTITINQRQKDGLLVTPREMEIGYDRESFILELKHNVDYSVEISDEGRSWLSIVDSPKTRGLETAQIQITATENTTLYDRRASIVVRQVDGDLCETVTILQDRAPIDLSASGTANCYIVNSSGWYSFNAQFKGNSPVSFCIPSTAEVLWETFNDNTMPKQGSIIESVMCTDGIVYFKIPREYREGNALIVAKDQNNIIVWSWHIWVTTYNPDSSYILFKESNEILMDRNLGALSSDPGNPLCFGLLYEWGRKDPFLSTSGLVSLSRALAYPSDLFIFTRANASTGTIDYSISHPTEYLFGVSPYSIDPWLFDNNETLWDTNKTIYDPCPSGWKVADKKVWDNVYETYRALTQPEWDITNRGYLLGEPYCTPNTWCPAPGTISSTLERFVEVGNEGRIWSSSQGVALYYGDSHGGTFYHINVGNYMLSSAHNVRCQKE